MPEFDLHQTEKEGQLRQKIDTTLAGLTKIETEKRRIERLESSADSGRFSLPLSVVRERSRHVSMRSSVTSGGCSEQSDLLMEEELNANNEPGTMREEILAAVHYAVCQLYCQERIPFSNEASIFHLYQAADRHHEEAISLLAKKLLGLPTDILEEITIVPNPEEGFQYLQRSSDPYSVYLLARAYHTGLGLPESESVNFEKAAELYE